MDTDIIINELLEVYPAIERETLLELLIACNGSKASTLQLIDESIPQRKRKLEKPLYQSSLSGLLKKQKKQNIPNLDPLVLAHQTHEQGQHKRTQFSIPLPPKKSGSRPKVIKLFHPDDVRDHLHPYVSLHRSFLPKDLSNKLLEHLVLQTLKLSANEFYLFGQLCKSDHATGVFLRDPNEKSSNGYIYNGKKIEANYYSDLLKEASIITEDFVNSKILPAQDCPLPFQQSKAGSLPWRGDRCVVNYYEEGASHLDWHSDRLSHMGPHSMVAAISVGATREFRVRRNYDNLSMNPEEKADPTQIYSILLPHNSMLVMHPGCQEEFKHCVQAMNGPLELNPISGSARFSLTYRHFPKVYYENLPQCKCKVLMTLRRAFKDVATRGRYFWTCEKKYLDKDCGTFYWADFNNLKKNYTYDENDKTSSISEWVAPDDYAKQKYKSENNKDEATPIIGNKEIDLGEDDLYR